MSKTKMYRRGQPYACIQEFIEDWWYHLSDVRYVYWNDKLLHMNFAAAMHMSGLCTAVARGILYKAVKNEEKVC